MEVELLKIAFAGWRYTPFSHFPLVHISSPFFHLFSFRTKEISQRETDDALARRIMHMHTHGTAHWHNEDRTSHVF